MTATTLMLHDVIGQTVFIGNILIYGSFLYSYRAKYAQDN